MKNFFILFFIVCCFGWSVNAQINSVNLPEFLFSDVETSITLTADSNFSGSKTILVNNIETTVNFSNGTASLNHIFLDGGKQTITIKNNNYNFTQNINVVPLGLSIIPPLLAILMALVFKEVVVSLIAGIFSGAAILGFYKDGWLGIIYGFFSVIDTYIMQALADWSHASIIVFTLLIGGMVSIISKNGGMQAIVNIFSRKAKTPKQGMFTTYFLGLAIFFDDYANTLVVGNTMKSLSDKLKISREKLAYLVDSTAAPVASLAFITTWIGAELSYIQNGIDKIDGLGNQVSAYGIFFNSLSYSFYPIFTLVFMFLLIYKQKDFGPMFQAEMNARKHKNINQPTSKEIENEFTAKKNITPKVYHALIPILVVILGTALGLIISGNQSTQWNNNLGIFKNLSMLIGNANSFYALLWGSFLSVSSAIALSILTKTLKIGETMETFVDGLKSMLPAIIILVLAWALAAVTENMHTADFITSLLRQNVSIIFFPSLAFILSGAIAFATGSSWGTMAILYPLLLPASWQLGIDSGYEHAQLIALFSNTTACVLCGSVFGDHCSPISDTTILSSLSTGCHHINHVKTQLPYALTTGGISIVFGTFATALGLPPFLSFFIGIAALFFVVLKFGKSVRV